MDYKRVFDGMSILLKASKDINYQVQFKELFDIIEVGTHETMGRTAFSLPHHLACISLAEHSGEKKSCSQ